MATCDLCMFAEREDLKVLMKTNQLGPDQSLPEQTANRKLTSCQNGELSEEATPLHTHTHTHTHTHL